MEIVLNDLDYQDARPVTINGTRYYKTADACLFLSISKSTIRRWVKAKKLPEPYRPSRKQVYYKESDLIKYVENHLAEPDLALINEKRTLDRDLKRFREEWTPAKQKRVRRDDPELYEAYKRYNYHKKETAAQLGLIVQRIKVQ